MRIMHYYIMHYENFDCTHVFIPTPNSNFALKLYATQYLIWVHDTNTNTVTGYTTLL